MLLVLLATLPACVPQDETTLEQVEEQGDAALLVGDTLTVGGTVAEVYSPYAFTIGPESLALGGDGTGTLVLVGEESIVDDLAEGVFVQVQGTVVRVVLEDLQETTPEVVPDAQVLEEFDGDIAIDAELLEIVPS